MKKVLCILLGLTRSFKQTYSNLLQYLILNNECDYEFTFIINTQNLTNEMNIFLQQSLNIKNHKLKEIIDYKCCNNIKKSLHITFLRLYETLKKEKDTSYDIYINLRFDLILDKPVNLNNYTDTFCIITDKSYINNGFHNKKWDLMWLGNNKNYKLFVYFLLNRLLKTWYNENIEEELTDNDIIWVIDKNIKLTPDNTEIIRNKTGLELKGQPCIEKIIYNLLCNKGNFVVSEKYENIFVEIIREQNYSKSFTP
jgi:hypothetical protein